MAILCVKYRQKIDFYVKNRKNMRFSRNFLQNMLENGHSNLQTNLWVHITSNIFKNIQFKTHGIAPTAPDLPTLKAYPTPGVSRRFGFFSLKWRERMNLKVPGAILPLAARFWAPGRKPLGGLVQRPLGELGLKRTYAYFSFSFWGVWSVKPSNRYLHFCRLGYTNRLYVSW